MFPFLNLSFVILLFGTSFQLVWALPMGSPSKRIGQTLTASTTKWLAACESAGGSLECLALASSADISLTASAGPCDQQNAADSLMTLTKTLGKPTTLFDYTQLFLQQPRDTSSYLATPYCMTAPKNAELKGFYQCQFEGSSTTQFVGGLKVGASGTIPLGLRTSPAGGCPAHPSGPIADASQLTDITSQPVVGGGSFKSATATISFLEKTATFGVPRPTLSLPS